MLNLYKYHSTPESLPGYKDKTKYIPILAFHHALYTLNGNRYPEGEPVIMKDPWFAWRYSQKILNKRWPEAESYIKHDSYIWQQYKSYFNIKD